MQKCTTQPGFADGLIRGPAAAAWALITALLLCQPTGLLAAEREFYLDNGDFYKGDVVDGFRTGEGTYIWVDERKYEGDFLENRMHGQGTYTWPDGRTYTGTFVADRREGRGVLTWPNGNRYEGDFLDNQMHGQGTFTWSNQDVYEGSFAEDQRTGVGEFRWHTGETYRGQFQAGVPEGQGYFEWPDGRTFEGAFVNGMKSGFGVLISNSNENRYEGMFDQDVRSGLGVFRSRDGTIYRGQFENDKMHGYVVKQSPAQTPDLQEWLAGELQSSRPLTESSRCALSIAGVPWMFESDECINGLAHGRGLAARVDGMEIIVNGRVVLGRLIEGEIEPLTPESG